MTKIIILIKIDDKASIDIHDCYKTKKNIINNNKVKIKDEIEKLKKSLTKVVRNENLSNIYSEYISSKFENN